MSDGQKGLDGTYTENGRPTSYSSITPFIVVSPALEAIAFYQNVFGAELIHVIQGTNYENEVVVAHAELQFESGKIQLGEPNSLAGLAGVEASTDNYVLNLYVADIYHVLDLAVEYGAVVREPISQFVSGDLTCSFRDPFGVRWSLLSRIEDLSDAKSAERVANLYTSQA